MTASFVYMSDVISEIFSTPCLAHRLEHEVGLELGEEAETLKFFPLSNSSREVRASLTIFC